MEIFYKKKRETDTFQPEDCLILIRNMKNKFSYQMIFHLNNFEIFYEHILNDTNKIIEKLKKCNKILSYGELNDKN